MIVNRERFCVFSLLITRSSYVIMHFHNIAMDVITSLGCGNS